MDISFMNGYNWRFTSFHFMQPNVHSDGSNNIIASHSEWHRRDSEFVKCLRKQYSVNSTVIYLEFEIETVPNAIHFLILWRIFSLIHFLNDLSSQRSFYYGSFYGQFHYSYVQYLFGKCNWLWYSVWIFLNQFNNVQRFFSFFFDCSL